MDLSMQKVLKGKTNKKSLIIIGAGGLGKVAQQIVHHQKEYEVVGFCDDKFKDISYDNGKLSAPVYFVRELIMETEVQFIIAIGDSWIRKKISNQIHIPLERCANVIHPNAYIDTNVHMGQGNIVMPHAILHSAAWVGNHNIVNSASIVEHKSSIGSYVSLSPNVTICGGVEVNDLCFIGAGTVIIQCLSIGGNTIVGANSLVIRDIPKGVVVYGSPAKIKRYNISEKNDD